jgi:branched-chain amino acid transport system ATP-binding protein
MAESALAIADRGYVLEHGRIVLSGAAAELARNEGVARAYLGRTRGTLRQSPTRVRYRSSPAEE